MHSSQFLPQKYDTITSAFPGKCIVLFNVNFMTSHFLSFSFLLFEANKVSKTKGH